MAFNIFNSVTKEYGASLTTSNRLFSSDISNFNAILDSYRIRQNSDSEKFIKSEFKELTVDYINNPNLNAVAILTEENNPIIGLFEGTRLILFDLFMRIMSHKNLLKRVGNINLETISFRTLRNYYCNAEMLGSFGHPEYEKYSLPTPQDEDRAHLAFLLTHLSMEFVFEHELSHHLNGHLGFLNKRLGLNTIAEFNSSDIGDNALTFQTLEMDADTSAACRCMNRCLELVKEKPESHPFTSENSVFSKFFVDPKETLSYLIFSINCFFKLMENGIIDHKTEYTYKHPPAILRSLMVCSTMMENLKVNYTEFDLKEVQSVFNEMYAETIRAKTELTGITPRKEDYSSKNFSQHPLSKKLLDEYSGIKMELNKYAYVKLAK